MHIRAGDTVRVICGDDKGVSGKVLKIDRQAGKLVVEGVNRVYKHVRRSQRNPQGGRLSKEMPVQISNVLLVCPACNQAARTGSRVAADGTKERICRNCGKATGALGPARKRPAAATKE